MLKKEGICLETIYEGKAVRILAYARITAGDRKVVPFVESFEELEHEDKSKVVAFISNVADNGFPVDHTKFKKLKGYDYWELRLITQKSLRILCYPIFNEKTLILLSIHTKKANKLRKSVLNKAQKYVAELKQIIGGNSNGKEHEWAYCNESETPEISE